MGFQPEPGLPSDNSTGFSVLLFKVNTLCNSCWFTGHENRNNKMAISLEINNIFFWLVISSPQGLSAQWQRERESF